jgi:hypothetical protein
LALGINNKINLVCISDRKYLKYLRTLLKSLSLTNSEICIHLTLINIKSRSRTTASLKKIFKDIHFSYIDKKFKKSHYLKAYCANYRVNAIKKLLEHGYQKILYVDVDSIFLKNIAYITSLYDNFDLSIHFRNENDKRFKVAAGVILLNGNQKTLEFVSAWSLEIEKNKTEWFADQVSFYRCYKMYSNDINFKHLDNIFIDWEFNPKSYIWTGKGKRKFRNLKYLKKILEIKILYLLKKSFKSQ